MVLGIVAKNGWIVERGKKRDLKDQQAKLLVPSSKLMDQV